MAPKTSSERWFDRYVKLYPRYGMLLGLGWGMIVSNTVIIEQTPTALVVREYYPSPSFWSTNDVSFPTTFRIDDVSVK
jgi:hypothetical protein